MWFAPATARGAVSATGCDCGERADADAAIVVGGGGFRDLDDQSPKRLQAFFHLHWVHHCSLWSMPYTLRHFLFSPRVRRFGERGDRLLAAEPGLDPGVTNGPAPFSDCTAPAADPEPVMPLSAACGW